MSKDNLPEVDVTSIGSTYRLIDFAKLSYKRPGDTDLLQSRIEYGDEAEITSMKLSILSRGLLESPLVMEMSEGESYRVLEGNRRCYLIGLLIEEGNTAADTGAALTKIRCEVRPSILTLTERTYNDWLSLNQKATEEERATCRQHVENQIRLGLGRDAMIRNTQRKNWSPIETARQIQQQLEAGESKAQLCKDFGLAENTLNARLSLLAKEGEMPEVIEAVDAGEVGFSVGRLLGNVKDEVARKEILKQAVEESHSTTEVKELIDLKHEAAKAAGSGGIKAQDRKKRAPRPPQGVKKVSRSAEALLQEVQTLASLRDELSKEDGDEIGKDTALDLEVAIKTLQWAVNHKDTRPLSEVIIGLEDI